MIQRTIRVPERGSTELSSDVWKELSRCPPFWTLVERGVVAVEQLRAGRVRLIGRCYVGRAVLSNDLAFEAHEKVPGALASLLRFAAGTDFRVERIAAPTSEVGALIALLVAHFVDAVRKYASRGREFRYRRERRVGSLIGGRLDITRTIRLRARGLRHLAAFDKDAIAFDVPINKTVLWALREVEHLARLIAVPPDTIARARALAMLFADCRDVHVLFGIRAEAARRADVLAATTVDPLVADMLLLAALILAHESFEQESSLAGRAPRAWFLNLENVFEKAVRSVLKVCIGPKGRVEAGRKAPPPIFPAGSDFYRANPDLVVKVTGGPVLVGDVKYKSWDGFAGAGDVYQLLVHASAYGSADAFLVFPSDRFEVRDLRSAVTGARVRFYSVDVGHLDTDLSSLTTDLLGACGAVPPQVIGAPQP